MTRTALVTGITGQDGSYLAELLMEKGYEVHGTTRRSTVALPHYLQHLLGRIRLHLVSPDDPGELAQIVLGIQPDEIYNLAGPTFVPDSWKGVAATAEAIAGGTARLLEAILMLDRPTRLYQASSSEMFGSPAESPQSETTPFHPRTPYGAAKAHAHYLVAQFRSQHRLFACSGILFNHESPRRRREFVTRRISDGVARIKLGLATELRLGNLEARRDWGFAKDYVLAMWLMLQQDRPDDYVIGTGRVHSVEDFVALAFDYVGLDWRDYVKFDLGLYRAPEGRTLVADARKAHRLLAWEPNVDFCELVHMMVHEDLARVGAVPVLQPA